MVHAGAPAPVLRREPCVGPLRSARPKSKEFAANLRRQTSQRGGAHIHHPLHRGLLPIVDLHPVLRPSTLMRAVAALRDDVFKTHLAGRPVEIRTNLATRERTGENALGALRQQPIKAGLSLICPIRKIHSLPSWEESTVDVTGLVLGFWRESAHG